MARESAGNLKFSADSGIHGIQLFECIFFTIFYNSTIFMCINMHALTKKIDLNCTSKDMNQRSTLITFIQTIS